MQTIDWVVIIAYVIAMIGMSVYLSRGQTDDGDYYVGGRELPWWAVGLSVVATQSSAISFISIPAFVALREGGGLAWLQYEFAVPLAMAFVLIFLVPHFRKRNLISVFEFLENRFGEGASKTLSFVFLFSRGVGTAVGVYATSLVLAAMLDISLNITILIIGVVAIIYDTIGGIKAVVYSDVIQLVLMLVGAGMCSYYAFQLGDGSIFDGMSADRFEVFKMNLGTDGESPTSFWAFLIGGFFLYSSYYGTDQSQVQRVLCTKNIEDARKTALINGVARFPLTLMYVVLGVSLSYAYLHSAELRESIPSDRLDYLVPKFILMYIPTGARGLILAGILAAAMSSLDSAINSLSAVTMRDWIEKHVDLDKKQQLRIGKITTVAWGVVVTALAFFVGNIDKTVVEAINKIGSAFYGPVLAIFIMGFIFKKINQRDALAGVFVGVAINVFLWSSGSTIHWMWWNLIGFVAAIAVAKVLSLALGSEIYKSESDDNFWEVALSGNAKLFVGILIGFFTFILTLGVIVHASFS